jgi:general stress protein 26
MSSTNNSESLVLAGATTIHDMLRKCRLAYLSTVDMVNTSSHLSLMRFTYLNDAEDGEVVIMSTNKKTKKFDNLQQQKGVALLVHDFEQGGNKDGAYSITLNGECRIVSDTQKAEDYREAHLANNPDYPQFIVGEDIAILCVGVKSARICDISDKVTTWDTVEPVAAVSS